MPVCVCFSPACLSPASTAHFPTHLHLIHLQSHRVPSVRACGRARGVPNCPARAAPRRPCPSPSPPLPLPRPSPPSPLPSPQPSLPSCRASAWARPGEGCRARDLQSHQRFSCTFEQLWIERSNPLETPVIFLGVAKQWQTHFEWDQWENTLKAQGPRKTYILPR